MLEEILLKNKSVICTGYFDDEIINDLDENQYKLYELDCAIISFLKYFQTRGLYTFIFTDSGWFDYLVASRMQEFKNRGFDKTNIVTVLAGSHNAPEDERPHPKEYSDHYISLNQSLDPGNMNKLTELLLPYMGGLLVFKKIYDQSIIKLLQTAKSQFMPIIDFKRLLESYDHTSLPKYEAPDYMMDIIKKDVALKKI